jgi:non-ribosomal peptide synthetase component F
MLDDLVRRDLGSAGVRDQPERAGWSGRPSRTRTWAELHDDTRRLSRVLAGLRLDRGARVAVCLPNGSEAVLTILALERAGLTPCLLPFGIAPDRVADAIGAANVRALVTQGRMGAERPAEALARVAAADFRVRFLLGFGPDLPDGAIDLDDVLGQVGTITDDPSAAGAGPAALLTLASSGRLVARSSASLVAAAAPVLAATGVRRGDSIASFVTGDDLKGLATGLVPALMSGASLDLYEVASRAVLDAAACGPGRLHLALPGWAERALPDAARPSGSLVFASEAPARFPTRSPSAVPVIDAVSLDDLALLVFEGDRPRMPESRLPFLGIETREDGSILVRGVGVASGYGEIGTPSASMPASEWRQTGFRLERQGTDLVGIA